MFGQVCNSIYGIKLTDFKQSEENCRLIELKNASYPQAPRNFVKPTRYSLASSSGLSEFSIKN